MAKQVVHTIKSGAQYLGIGEFRMRMIVIKEKRLPNAKVVTRKRGKGTYERWEFPQSDLDAYRETTGATKDGRKAFLVRLNEAELVIVQKFLKAQAIEIEPRYRSKKS